MIFQNNLFESEENDINKKKKKMMANKELSFDKTQQTVYPKTCFPDKSNRSK